MLRDTKRAVKITRLMLNGETAPKLAPQFELSVARVQQIFHEMTLILASRRYLRNNQLPHGRWVNIHTYRQHKDFWLARLSDYEEIEKTPKKARHGLIV